MSAPDVTIFVGADDMAMPSADDGANRTMLKPSQVTQLVQWHDKAHAHQVAHAKLRTLHQAAAVTVAVLISVLGVFSGAVWTVDMADAGVPSETVKWVAAIAGFMVAVLVALEKGGNFAGRADDHKSAAESFAGVRNQLEVLKAKGLIPYGLSIETIEPIGAAFKDAECKKRLEAGSWMLRLGQRRAREDDWGKDLLYASSSGEDVL